MKRKTILKSIICLLLVLILSGCFGHTTPSHFYMLNTETSVNEKQQCKYNSIGIMPITVAGYLRQPQIITQTETTEYKVNEFARWAEPLKDTIDNELSASFLKQLNVSEILKYPWEKSQPDILLSLNIRRFHCVTYLDKCILTASWNITENQTKKSIAKGNRNLTIPLPDNDFSTITEQMSNLLRELSQDIIQDIAKEK